MTRFGARTAATTLALVTLTACSAGNSSNETAPQTVPATTSAQEQPDAVATAEPQGGTRSTSTGSGGGETTKWVVSDGQGRKVRSGGVVKFVKLGTGRWEVTFDSDVSRCAQVATVADPGNGLVYTPGLVFTASGHNSRNGVYVETKNLAGGLADFPYHLWVRCSASDRWVVVGGDGAKIRSAGVTGVKRLAAGQYEVTFSSDVRGCAYLATIGDPGSGLVYAPGLVFTAGGHGSRNGVYVETKNLRGGLADLPWHMQVRCTSSAEWAVVGGDGSRVRGARVNAVARLSPGRYEVTFNRDVRACAYLATGGDPGAELVYVPGLVFTASGHGGHNGVYVETKNLAGGLADMPFHLNVVC